MKKNTILIILIIFLYIIGAQFSLASVMSSTNYKIEKDSINAGGIDNSSSTNYKILDTIGEIATGLTTSASYKLHAGYRAKFPPVLIFSVNDNSINLGTLSISSVSTDAGSPSSFSVATNAGSGYAVVISGNTLTNGANNIDGIGATAAVSSPGTEQFGINLVDNSDPDVGAVHSGGSGTPYGQYAIINNFAFNSGDTIASSSKASESATIFTISYLGNINASTVAGNYSTDLTLTATATF